MADVSVVVVTGASGFIGAHIVKACLMRNLHVNACVRDKDAPKNGFLVEMANELPGTLTLFSADLAAMGAYDAAVANADAVIHAAAQVDPSRLEDPWVDMVEPSTQGVRNVLSSVNKFPNVKHFVQTSSMAAVGMAADGRVVSEEDWSTVTIDELPYNFAKTQGEMVVWSETRNKPYTVACINPSMVFGPCLAKPHAKASPFVFRQALFGNRQPNMPYSVVDVRDVATAHIEAMLRPEADRQRFILDGDAPTTAVNEIIQQARALFPGVQFTDAPGDPGWNDAWNAFFGPQSKVSGSDNSLSKRVLGLRYTPMHDTIRDTVASLIDTGFVPAKPTAKL